MVRINDFTRSIIFKLLKRSKLIVWKANKCKVVDVQEEYIFLENFDVISIYVIGKEEIRRKGNEQV